MRHEPANRAMVPEWVYSFAFWAAHCYTAGLLLVRTGCCRNLSWLVTVGRVVVYLGGVVLVGLYTVATANYGKPE